MGKIRLMSMHGAKGLAAQVVFIPGLEEGILPANKSRMYPGLVQEEARLLYVSITRAKALCVLSFSENRQMFGKPEDMAPSQFASFLNGTFTSRTGGLNPREIVAFRSVLGRIGKI
jgi:DNA helicase II / ATP-dependent DNA helicase PcrA